MKSFQFKSGKCMFDIFGAKSYQNLYFFDSVLNVYISHFLWCNKKLEMLPKLEISERSVLRIQMENSYCLIVCDMLIRFKDLEYFRTPEKMEKKMIDTLYLVWQIFNESYILKCNWWTDESIILVQVCIILYWS